MRQSVGQGFEGGGGSVESHRRLLGRLGRWGGLGQVCGELGLDGSTVSSGGRVVKECIGLSARAVAVKGQVAGRVVVNECAI